jgi:hypothetical protein
VSIHLIALVSDEKSGSGFKPSTWKATYLVASSPGPGSARSAGRAYWFEIEVRRTADGHYKTKLVMDDIPEQQTFAAAIGKLAEWAAQVSAGIRECGNLPDEGFPLEMKAPPIDGFGFDSLEAARAYGRLYDPPREPEEYYYDSDGKPGHRGDPGDRTYYFVEVPKVGGVVVPAWGLPYEPPAYRGKPERKSE